MAHRRLFDSNRPSGSPDQGIPTGQVATLPCIANDQTRDAGASGLSGAQLAVTSAALSGDAGRLYHIASNLLGDGIPFESVLFDLLIPAERSLGQRWQQGDYLISEEHAATAAIETVISLLAGSFDQPDEGPTVVVAMAEGDDHSLPGRALAAYLLFLGYRTVLLGGRTVASDLGEYLESETPDALALSSAMAIHLIGARAVIKEAHDVGVPVVAGGNGFGVDGKWAVLVGADTWVPSLKEVAETLDAWDPDPARAEAGAVDPDDDLETLLDERLSLIIVARSKLGDELVEPKIKARVLSELGLVLDAVAAALLVDDAEIVEQLFHWQQETLAAHGLDFGDALARAMRSALEDGHPRAAAMLGASLETA